MIIMSMSTYQDKLFLSIIKIGIILFYIFLCNLTYQVMSFEKVFLEIEARS